MNISQILRESYSKDTTIACNAAERLIEESKLTDSVYKYWGEFVSMLDSKNAYTRMYGLSLIAVNAQWDDNDLLKETLSKYLSMIKDTKPIVVRICIQRLIYIINSKPLYIPLIKTTLESMDFSIYRESMVNLIRKDVLSIFDNL